MLLEHTTMFNVLGHVTSLYGITWIMIGLSMSSSHCHSVSASNYLSCTVIEKSGNLVKSSDEGRAVVELQDGPSCSIAHANL